MILEVLYLLFIQFLKKGGTVRINNLKLIKIIYNLFQIGINGYIVYGLSQNFSLSNPFGFNTVYNPMIEHFIRIHLLSKYIDFFDTVLMILGNNTQQITFLHLFHHSTISLVWKYLLDKKIAWGSIYFGAFINSTIHVMMYLHYLITTFKIKNPFKILLTKCQILQFYICLLHSCLYPFYETVNNSNTYILQIIYQSVMIYLFNKFYHNRYKIKNNTISKEAKYIKINNTIYDISNFHHPGGNIINHYTNQDATEVFKKFHSTSSFALKTLQTLQASNNNTIIIKDKSLLEYEFEQLQYIWEKKGYYKSNILSYYPNIVTIISTLLLSLYIAQYNLLLSGIIISICWIFCGFLQHYCGHFEFTGNRAIDLFVQNIVEGLLKGGSASWWREKHNKHHSKTNILHYDEDWDTLPFLSWDKKLSKNKCWLRFQYIYFIPILSLYVPYLWFSTKIHMFKNKKFMEVTYVILHYFIFAMILNSYNYSILQGIYWFLIGYMIQGIYLGFVFSLNHFPLQLEYTDTKEEWVIQNIVSTLNYSTKNSFITWITGHLNYQIEHHLVFDMPAYNYPFIQNDIIQLCKKYDIEYKNFSLREAIKMNFTKLKNSTKIYKD